MRITDKNRIDWLEKKISAVGFDYKNGLRYIELRIEWPSKAAESWGTTRSCFDRAIRSERDRRKHGR